MYYALYYKEQTFQTSVYLKEFGVQSKSMCCNCNTEVALETNVKPALNVPDTWHRHVTRDTRHQTPDKSPKFWIVDLAHSAPQWGLSDLNGNFCWINLSQFSIWVFTSTMSCFLRKRSVCCRTTNDESTSWISLRGDGTVPHMIDVLILKEVITNNLQN